MGMDAAGVRAYRNAKRKAPRAAFAFYVIIIIFEPRTPQATQARSRISDSVSRNRASFGVPTRHIFCFKKTLPFDHRSH